MTAGVARPAPVRFTDLADPRYPEAAMPMREALAGYGATLEINPEAMLLAASERTGLDDFGDPAFRERLEVLCSSLRDEAGLSDVGVAVAFEQLVGNLVNRLRLEALIAEHPQIEDIVIARPIIICGLPRTGTTHLLNLMAADPNLRHLPYWESLEPFPAPDEEDDQPRRDRCAAGLDLVNTSMPEFKRMHDMTVDHAHEEIQLLANDFSDDALRNHVLPADLRRVLQVARSGSVVRLPQAQPAGHAVPARRDAVGAEVTPASRTVPHPVRHLPRRDLRCHTS